MSMKKKFGGKVRIRVCGVCIVDEQILMVKHRGLGERGFLWIPPGGGVEYGSSLDQNLIREFKEETGLEIKVTKFLFIHEYLMPPIHAIELFYEVKRLAGKIITGYDPEFTTSDQIIEQVKYMSFEELNKTHPYEKHQIFGHCRSLNRLLNLSGYFKFENNSIK